MELILPYKDGEIVLIYESPHLPIHNPNSTDNIVPPEETYDFSQTRPSSRHRVTTKIDATVIATRLLLADGGASGVHARSALVKNDQYFVAVGPYVCALELPNLRLLWKTRV